jgi:amidase
MLAMRAGATAMRHRDWLLLAEERTARRRSWADFFTRYDILLAPVAFTAAFEHQTQGNLYTRTLPTSMGDRAYADLIAWTTQFGYVYLPATVVPAGWTPDGLPVGIQIVGRYLGDRTCLAMAARLENLLGGYRIPPIALA